MHPEGVQRMADRMEAADTGWQGGLQHAMTAMQEALVSFQAMYRGLIVARGMQRDEVRRQAAVVGHAGLLR